MCTDDKPVAAALGWSLLDTRYPFETPWFALRQDRVRIPGRGDITYTYLHDSPAVFVVPVTKDGQVVLIRQYRYPVDAWCLEVPAGGTHDRSGMALEDVAARELREETGAISGTLERVGTFYPSNGSSDQESHVFLALEVELDYAQALEVSEQIEVQPTPAPQALALARSGGIADGQSALALLLCEGLLRRHGYIGVDMA